MHNEPQISLLNRLDRIYRLCEQARGLPLYVSVVMLAHNRQAEGVKQALDSLTVKGLPEGTPLDIVILVMPDEHGSRGPVGELLRGTILQTAHRTVEVMDADRPLAGIHYLFPYGRTVHRGVDWAIHRVHQREQSTARRFKHIIVRISGDVIVKDDQALAKLIEPLNEPAFGGVVVSSARQESDWAKDELARRWLVKKRMLAIAGSKDRYVPCSISAPQGSLSAYMAPMLAELRLSETWGGGEDGVGFGQIDRRLKGVIVRDAVVYHCHKNRSVWFQLQVIGEWFCTGVICKLNEISGKRGVDQSNAYDRFMRKGILTPRSQRLISELGRVVGYWLVIQGIRFWHMIEVASVMLWTLLTGR